MRMIITGLLFCITTLSFAANLFNVSGTASTITVTSNVRNFTYTKAGIRLDATGFALSNATAECTTIQNGYCIFEISRTAPKTFSISGSGSRVSGAVCLNAYGPLSCQSYAYTVSSSPTPSYLDYVYVVNSGNNTISLCLAGIDGTLSNCQNSGATLLSAPQSIVFNSTGQYAYISSKGAQGGAATGRIVACAVNSTTKTLGSCVSNVFSATNDYPQQVAYLNQGASEYIYVGTTGGTGTVYRCSVNGTAVTSCADTGAYGTGNVTGVAVSADEAYLYVVDNTNSGITNCTINFLADIDCSGSSVNTSSNPEYITLDIGGNPAFLPTFSNGVFHYVVAGGELTGAGVLSGASGLFNQPYQATPNSTGANIFISNRGTSAVSVCQIASNNTFTNCQTSAETFSTPLGIAVLPY